MAYQTGTATSPNDLLQKLVTWLVNIGWVQDMSQADGTGWRAHLHKGSVYVNLKSTTGAVNPWAFTPSPSPNASDAALHIYLGTGFSGAANWNAQAGGPVLNGTSTITGHSMPLPTGAISAYYFFSDATADNVVVVVEKTTGVFTHLGWGTSLNKSGTWTGGPYSFAATHGYGFANDSTTTPGAQNGPSARAPFMFKDPLNGAASGYVRADVDSFTGKWVGCTDSTSQPSGGYTGRNCATEFRGQSTAPPSDIPNLEYFLERTVSILSSQAHLVPVRIWVSRDAGGYSLLGTMPIVFWTRAVGNGFAPGTVLTLGADSYMLFPEFAVKKVG
jgi:hypothetical protein